MRDAIKRLELSKPMPSSDRATLIARLALAGAMMVAVILVLHWAGDRTFTLDEWDFFTQRGEWTADNFFRPTNGHLIALPLVFYKGLLSAFGATSHLPLTLLMITLQLTVAGLVYVIAARRLGVWIALIPALLILFYGAGWEVLVNTAGMQNQFATASGLGMILALDRRDRRGDALACLLLVASLASFTVGLAFAVGAGVRIIAERTDRRSLRRLAIVVGPLVLYAIWFAWARKYHQSSVSLYSVGSLWSGIFDQLNAALAGITGLFRHVGSPSLSESLDIGVTRTPALVFVLMGLLALRILRGPRLKPAAWAALATLGAYLILVAVGLNDLRGPTASRYAYMATVLLMLAGTELLDGLRIARAWVLAAAAGLCLSLLANIAEIQTAGSFFEQESTYNRAELAALELARPTVDPTFITESGTGYGTFPHQDLIFPASDYFAAVDRDGSPAYTPEELEGAPDPAREAADKVLAAALGLSITKAPPVKSGESEPPLAPTGGFNAEVTKLGSCIVLSPSVPGGLYGVFHVPPGGLAYYGKADPKEVLVGRFADAPSAPLPAAGPTGLLRIPADDVAVPWQASFELTGRTTFCPVPPDA